MATAEPRGLAGRKPTSKMRAHGQKRGIRPTARMSWHNTAKSRAHCRRQTAGLCIGTTRSYPGRPRWGAMPVSIYRQGIAACPAMGGLSVEESAEVVVAASNEPGVAADG